MFTRALTKWTKLSLNTCRTNSKKRAMTVLNLRVRG